MSRFSVLIGILLPLLTLPQDAPAPAKPKPAAEKRAPRLDLYGDPLPEGAIRRFGSLRLRHVGDVHALDFSPDGKTIASGGEDGTVRLWNAETGRVLRRWDVGTQALSVRYSPDGMTLACGSGEPRTWSSRPTHHAVFLWDMATGREVKKFEGQSKDNRSVAFSGNGTLLAVGASDGEEDHRITVWEIPSGKKVQDLTGLPAAVSCVTFSPDTTWLAAGDMDDAVRIWDMTDWKEARKLGPFSDESAVYALAVSPDGTRLASAHWDQKIRLWSTSSWEHARTLEGHHSAVWSVDFSSDGKLLVSGSTDGSVGIWDPESGKLRGRLTAHGADRRSQCSKTRPVAISPDGNWVAACHDDSRIIVWDVKEGRERTVQRGPAGHVQALAFGQGGRVLVSGDHHDTVRLWDVATGRQVLEMSDAGGPIYSIAVSADGNTIASGDNDGRVCLWDASTGELIGNLSLPETKLGPGSFVWRAATSVEFTAGDSSLLVGTTDGMLLLFDLTSRKTRVIESPPKRESRDSMRLVPLPSPPRWARHFPLMGHKQRRAILGHDGETAVFVASGSEVVGRRLASGEDWFRQSISMKEGVEGPMYEEPRSLAISPDGQILALGKGWGTVELWEFFSGRLIRRWEGHELRVVALDFSPDGGMLATTSFDSTIRLWDISTGKEMRRFRGHDGWAMTVLFSPDGRTLATGGIDNTALLWDVSTVQADHKTWRRALRAEELEALWADLAGEDAGAADRAIRIIAANPADTLPFLEDRLPGVSPGSPESIPELIEDLNDDDFSRREEATRDLLALGESAEVPLRKALAALDCSPEMRSRAERILRALHPPYRESPSPRLRALRCVRALETIRTPEAVGQLRRLAHTYPSAVVRSQARQAWVRIRPTPRGF